MEPQPRKSVMPTPLRLLRVAKYLDDTEKQHLDPMEFPRSNASGGWNFYVYTPQKSNVDTWRIIPVTKRLITMVSKSPK